MSRPGENLRTKTTKNTSEKELLGCKALPEEPKSKIQWKMGRGLKRESSFEEPERKFRGKEQQQEPMEAATAPKLHLYQEVLIFSGDGLKI